MNEWVDPRFYALEVHHDAVVVRRTAQAFPSLEVMDAVLGDMVLGLEPWRAHRALLIDLRAVEGRNDSAFERVLQRYGPRRYAGGSPAVVLVCSLGGKLQVQRHARRDNTRTVATEDVDFAAEVLGLSLPRLQALLGDARAVEPGGATGRQRRAG